MQRHLVPLHGAESWGGGGWGRTASARPCGRVRAVWRRCPVPSFSTVLPKRRSANPGDHKGRPYEYIC